MMITHKKIVFLTALGGALEFYDFTIYALFAPYISHHFFPNTDPTIGFLNTFAVFALGYFTRPLGGIVFGHMGDKWGRKAAFSSAVFTMAIATLLMGCLPTYASIGIMAPILLIGLRLIQGFSVGGEIPGAALFTIEHAPPAQRGTSIGIVFMCITLGNTLGSIVGFILTHYLTNTQMIAWGWRIPFILGFCVGIISYIIRKNMIETPVFLNLLHEKKQVKRPFYTLITTARHRILQAFFLTALTSGIVSFFLYLPTYLTSMIQINISNAYLINVISFCCFAIMTAFWGWVSDHVNRRRLLNTGALLLMILSYPLFYLLTQYGEAFLWWFILSFSLIGSMINGSYVLYMADYFPANIRYSGIGLSYSLGVAVFSGIAPLAFTALIQYFHCLEAPGFYLVGCAISTWMVTRRKLDLF